MSKGSATLMLARHGRTAYNHSGFIQGSAPVPLDSEGEQQALALANAMAALNAPPQHLWSSDLRRAQQTAQAVANKLGLTVKTDPRLREQAFGAYEGRKLSDLLVEDPAFHHGWTQDFAALCCPGGETFGAVQARMLSWFEHARPRRSGEVVLAVSHGLAITALLSSLGGVSGREVLTRGLFRHSNAAYTTVQLDPYSGATQHISQAVEHVTYAGSVGP